MKHILVFILLYGSLSMSSRAQTVASDCNAPDSIKTRYMTGADMLAVKEILVRDLSYKDSVRIPQNWTDTFLRPMLAIYNAVSLPARDTVVNRFFINAPYGQVMNQHLFRADTNLLWMKNFKNGIVPSGYAPVDDLMSEFELQFYHYSPHPVLPTAAIYTKSDSNYNMKALRDRFLAIPDIMSADAPWSFTLPMFDITAEILPDHVALVYSYGWGDCMSGCFYRRFWKFLVYPDCSVTYAGSYGDLLTGTGIPVAAPGFQVAVQPNPFRDFLTINNAAAAFGTLHLYDVMGRVVISRQLPPGKQQLETASLPAGWYYYRITAATGQSTTGKLLKQ